MKRFLSFLMVVLFSASMWATTYTVAGGDDATILGVAWTPSQASNDMTLVSGNYYKLEKTFSALAAEVNFGFKVCVDHGWATAYPSGNKNVTVPKGATSMLFTFDADSKTVDGFNYCTVAGSSEPLFGASWDEKNTAADMTFANNVYKFTKSDVTLGKGTITFKVVKNHDWANAWPSDNYSLVIPADAKYDVEITFNPFTYAVNATATIKEEVVVIPTIKLHGPFVTDDWADTEAFELSGDKKTASLTTTISKGSYKFGVKIDGEWTSNGSAINRANPSKVIIAGSGDCSLDADVSGEYTFTWTYATNTLAVTYPEYKIELPTVALAGTFNDWSTATKILEAAEDSLTASVKVNLSLGVDSFKIVSDGAWLSLNGDGESCYRLHRGYPSAPHVNLQDARNFVVEVDKAGEYTFTWTYADSTIAITFPDLESFAVTVSAPTNSTITVNDGETAIGANVQEGTELTVSAAPKDPAAYEITSVSAYKTGDQTTKVAITDGKLTMPAFPITITAEEQAVAYQTIYFVNKDGWETVKAYVYIDEDHKYKEWQGEAMTKTEEKAKGKDVYSYRFPAKYTKIIFNNGGKDEAEKQTENHTWNAAKPYICNGIDYATAEDVILDATVKYYIVGDAAVMGAWDPTAVSSPADAYTFSALAAGTYKFRISLDGTWDNTKGYSNLTAVTPGLKAASEDNNIIFTLAKAGDVTITYNATKFTVEGDFAMPVVALAGTFNKWALDTMEVADGKLSASIKVNLTAGVDSFKIVKEGVWLSLNGEGETNYRIKRDWPQAPYINQEEARNFVIDVDKAGEYTFKWTYSKDSLYVTFPDLESFAVTVSAPTNSTITVKDGETAIGANVQEGTVLTVNAAPKDPAAYEIISVSAYKTGDPTTKVAITDGKLTMPAYPITITAEEKAVVYQTLYFVDKEGWSGVNAYAFIDEGHVYKEWPGEEMKKEDHKVKEKDLYSYTFPAKYTTIIFNKKGETTTQTKDMLWSAATPYYCNGFWYASEEAVVLDATAKYYITGDAAVMGSWAPDAIKVASDSYTFPNLAAGTYKMKITLDGTWETEKGYSNLTVKDPGFITDGENNIIFKLNEPSDVTVTYNATTFTVTGNFAQKEYYIAGDFTNWKKDMVKMTEKDDNYTATIEITATTEQQFKVVSVHGTDSVWYGLENYAAMTYIDGVWTIGGGEANIGLVPTKAGDYTFTFNPEGPSLKVEMPEQGGGTALDGIEAGEKAVKVMKDGQLIIFKDGKMYNVMGALIR